MNVILCFLELKLAPRALSPSIFAGNRMSAAYLPGTLTCNTLLVGVGSVNSASTSLALATPGSSTSTTMLPRPYPSRLSSMLTRGSLSTPLFETEDSCADVGCTSEEEVVVEEETRG